MFDCHNVKRNQDGFSDRRVSFGMCIAFLLHCSLSTQVQVTEGNLFFETRKAIAGIIEICGTQGFRGVDIHLLHQDVLAENIVVS